MNLEWSGGFRGWEDRNEWGDTRGPHKGEDQYEGVIAVHEGRRQGICFQPEGVFPKVMVFELVSEVET